MLSILESRQGRPGLGHLNLVAAQGEALYRRECYSCHGANDFGAAGRDRRETRVGRVTRLADIGTDPISATRSPTTACRA